MKKILAFLILTLSFTVIAKSQNSYYMEFKMEVGSGKEGIKNISKTWHNANASRIEMDMNIPGMGVKKNVMLMNKNNPGVIITLDDAKKSYTEIKSPNDTSNYEKYTIEILGKEKVGIYNCTHAKIKSKDQVFEVWTTKEIDAYKELQKSAFLKNQTKGMNNAFLSGELEGMMVKMKDASPKEAMSMELMKFEKGNFPQSMFEIPAGYTKGMSFDPSKMQNMSPEERQKMMEELMKQYGKEEKE
jgi:hypothetical protein